MSRKFGWALASVVALGVAGVSNAMAADMPVKAYKAPPPVVIYSWTGCYVGGNAGGDWARVKVDEQLGGAWPVVGPADFAALTANGSPRINVSGFTAGGQIGCNWQTGKFVFGIEADGAYTDLSSTAVASVILPTAGTLVTNTAAVSARSLYTVRGRAGYAADRALFYVTGGVAFGKVNFADTQVYVNGVSAGAVSSTRTGYAVGVGVEYALTQNWIVGAEYLYVNLGSTGFNTAVNTLPAFTNAWNAKFEENIVRARLSYKFDWAGPVVAKY